MNKRYYLVICLAFILLSQQPLIAGVMSSRQLQTDVQHHSQHRRNQLSHPVVSPLYNIHSNMVQYSAAEGFTALTILIGGFLLLLAVVKEFFEDVGSFILFE